MQFCFVIPNYCHINGFADLITHLSRYNLPIVVVNDASTSDVSQKLIEIAEQYELVELLHHSQNQGKGGAVQTGLSHAFKRGYSHALQIDADGQHNPQDIDKLIALSKQYPNDLISGRPIYDESVPKHRYWARYITHFWVCIETLGLQIKDTMCGFRVYPLAAYDQLALQQSLGKRMDFDIEVMVRLYWQGCNVRFIPTKVIYPEAGLSHFRAFEDNVLISWMHTKLCFGMLLRAPKLMLRNIRRWCS